MRRDVRILLVGDEGVGKSTIITSLIKESYVAHVQHVVPEVTIPPEVTPENVTTYIVDSGCTPQDRPHLESEIRKAHVICVVYAIDNPHSFDRIPAYWLPYFRQLGVNVPVILVGNKMDLRGGEVTNEALEGEVLPVMNEFKEVDTCVECSAKMPLNVPEVFYLAQKAVLHPTAPLYDSRDHDQDGALKHDELEELFSTSPGNPWVSQKFPDTTVADDAGAVTLQGWLAQWSEVYDPTKKMNSVVNVVEIEGVEKTLVLQEFGSRYEAETLKSSKKTDLADVIVYVHDSSDTNSFSYISNLRQQYSLDHIPTLFVATKSDLDLAMQFRTHIMDEDMQFDSGATAFSALHQYPHIQPANGSGDKKMLDLVFVQDCTGSQGSYITSATKNIQAICQHIFESGKLQAQEDLRIGLVAYRDHPPQDHTYVTKNFGFSSDINKVENDLSTLYASGGGDGPEAVTAALAEALNMGWRPEASKMVVLIADAPPHGIGEYGDGFDDGSPDGNDPLQVARLMANRGITLFFVACEPALSGYSYATDFFQALTNITSGLMLPLTTADLLTHAIVGSVLENLDMERLVREVGQAVSQRILGNNESVDDVARELHERLLLRNESTKKVVIESIYRESEEAKHNVSVYMQAPSLAEARPLLKRVPGTRFTDKYLHARMSSSRTYTPYPYPPRGIKTSSVTSSAPAIPTPSHSPPRKVVTDFAAFGAPKNVSVFGTAVASTPFSLAGGKAAFGGIRNGGSRGTIDDEDDEDDGPADDGAQRVELREDSITFDQARRIAMQSAWRSARI
ncbi:hypothetical protein EW026_g7355 [Hermanssonia centrifuga]|uniref:Mitochondrial Rho GTPase 1 n=1 Tax=Hermanssonia centrifuga TaxID=98765 RepID=A0A4S4K837_9APHY|nr:hypothetical protein EW026_g7355 [Hermanssonia centrifuga]